MLLLFKIKSDLIYESEFKYKSKVTLRHLNKLHLIENQSGPAKVVPDHFGGWPRKINAWFLYTHMVYL